MPLSAKVTTDRSVIQRWVQDRGGYPATVKSHSNEGDPVTLYIDFPGHPANGTIERTSWDEFFRRFEQGRSAFLYQDRTSTGVTSRLFRIVSRQ